VQRLRTMVQFFASVVLLKLYERKIRFSFAVAHGILMIVLSHYYTTTVAIQRFWG
jgi:hypothetical protein